MAEQNQQIPQKTGPAGSEAIGEDQLPPKLRQLWQKAGNALDLNNYDYVISLLQAVLKEEPCFLDGRKRLREAAIRKKEGTKRLISTGGGGLGAMRIQPMVKKDPANAIVQIEKEVLAVDPFNAQGNQLLFEACSAAGMPASAGFALETLVRGNPENVKYIHQLGDYYMGQGFYEEAALTYAKAVTLQPHDLEAVQKEKNASAKATMEKQNLKGSFKDNLRNADQAAQLEAENRSGMTRDQVEQQIAAFQAKYAEDNTNLQTVRRLGELYEQIDDYDNALVFYEWAHHLSNGDVALEKKVVETRELQRSKQMRELSKWLADNPEHPDFDKVKADLETFEAQHYETQAAEYASQVERNPTDNALRFKLGEALYHAGKLQEAIPQLQRAQASPNLRLQAMMLLGKCYEGRNMNDLAIDQLKKASDELTVMDDTKKEVLYTLGLVYEKTGDQENHLDCMKQIYQADYSYKDVAQRVESSYS